LAVCLDTSYIVDLLAGQPSAVDLAANLGEPAVISAVSFYELLFGARDRRRIDRVEALAREYAVVPAYYDVCAMAAAIQARLRGTGTLIPVLDAIIAATAILAEGPLLTTDEHFRRIPPDFGLKLVAY
jgi:predicted nucleic acid-binding protein